VSPVSSSVMLTSPGDRRIRDCGQEDHRQAQTESQRAGAARTAADRAALAADCLAQRQRALALASASAVPVYRDLRSLHFRILRNALALQPRGPKAHAAVVQCWR